MLSASGKLKLETKGKTWQSASLTHLTSIQNLSKSDVERLLVSATEMKDAVEKNGGCDICKHKVLATMFYEPSTRTSCSFQAAMSRLGGTFLPFNEQQSSAKKGESLDDAIRTLGAYCDVIVLRHPTKGSAETARVVSDVPIINAGDGAGEHPTQV